MAPASPAYTAPMDAIRKVLLWLALLALPLHGIAGAGVGLCHAMHGPDTMSVHASDADCGSTPSEQPAKTSSAKCATATACGITAAPTLGATMIVAASSGVDILPAPAEPDFGFLTGAPERPPRTFA